MTIIENGLYNSEFEKDSCGFGLIANIRDEPGHGIVTAAIGALRRLTHRGAVAADGKTGDGCGLLLRAPQSFLRTIAAEQSIELGDLFATGAVFLPTADGLSEPSRARIESEIRATGLTPAGWRKVPVNADVCGAEALRTLPAIEHIFVNAPEGLTAAEFERRLFIARRRVEVQNEQQDDLTYIASLSHQSLSYKAMVMPEFLDLFYPDLQDERLTTSVCIFHQRFSTNTLPQWKLAQPFRMLAHNGEINTIAGNRNWARARRTLFTSKLVPEMNEFDSLVSMQGSDSASLDNMLEVLVMGGMDVLQAMRLLIPPAWQTVDAMDPDVRAFYEFFAPHIEPWDGPAGIVLTHDRYAACILDRNGLRPARYTLTSDDIITIASETGVNEYPAEQIVTKGKLGPGDMIAVDLETGSILENSHIEALLSARAPYKAWLKDGVRYLDTELVDVRLTTEPMDELTMAVYKKMFGISYEERNEVIRVLAEAQREAVGSMGDDAPIAVMSQRARSVYDYFRQQFAQVTNPPIDPLRESIVMSLQVQVGKEINVFDPQPEHAELIVLNSPVLSQRKLRQLVSSDGMGIGHQMINLNRPIGQTWPEALDAICDDAVTAVKNGKLIILLSDRYLQEDLVPVHALLATSAVHHRLVAEGLRCECNIIVETGTARDPHHFACLIGYGATAVYPYMVYQTLTEMVRTGEVHHDLTRSQLGRSYRRGIRKGLLKIMSKMGISTIASYRGAHLFEIVGLNQRVVNRCFPGSVSRIQGAAFQDLEEDQLSLARKAWDVTIPIEHGGLLKHVFGGEYHMYNAEVIGSLQRAVVTNDPDDYAIYAQLVNERPASTLRDLLAINYPDQPVDIDQVEAIEAITPRFDCAGMSLGALSPEAHEALAIAMNRLNARSNSGEGGEDKARYNTEKRSKIKQVASGRFGVTPAYLVSAEVIQIKMAQGAKPGEGGQLPGHKVDETIARLRFAKPGVGLISPPPHHDIYSIEDLAQLIFDLKQVNPTALISVKLVSAPGVGTIAAGVAKAYADLITISGHDGGTGASPLTSVKYAGSPWEIGLAEAHQTLRLHDLRGKVQLQADGGLKTGLDVVKAALLGAESFGFGTAPLIALGCKYLRICHLNNCATGVATQNETLRKKHFVGLPDMVINYFRFVAAEVRQILAKLGVHSLAEIIGRVDLLEELDGITAKQARLDLSPLLSDGGALASTTHTCTVDSNQPFDKGELAERMVEDIGPAIDGKTGGTYHYEVRNNNRSIGARLSGEIARVHDDYGMSDKPVTLQLTGSAGQSLGAWNAGGLNIFLEGDANDYVGKGMAGGKIVVRPPRDAIFKSQDTVILGNTCLYGATGGELYAAGRVGERFAVRNSGATTVVEGAGDHCCEYMTGGVVVVLGETGINFGAGMTNGFAYVLDMRRDFVDRYNHELIDIHRITQERMEAHLHHLHGLIAVHQEQTGSAWASHILDDFRTYLPLFWLIKPKATDISQLLESLRRAA
ncbi:MAG: glutamate synthase large subunit [Gammaproteobacteria bacterium]|nr:glutamate synthase large subunit [Gammaproteobacteria bacterium]